MSGSLRKPMKDTLATELITPQDPLDEYRIVLCLTDFRGSIIKGAQSLLKPESNISPDEQCFVFCTSVVSGRRASITGVLRCYVVTAEQKDPCLQECLQALRPDSEEVSISPSCDPKQRNT